MTEQLPPLALNAWLRWDIITHCLEKISAPEQILEIGMGQGAVGARLAQIAPYTGVEPDQRSQSVARSRLSEDANIFDDLADIGDSSFDLVAAFEVLEHIEDDADALDQWRQRVAPGGHLIISVPAHSDRYGAWDVHVGHFRRYSRQGLTDLLVDSGLKPVEIAAVGHPLGNVLEHGRNTIARIEKFRHRRASSVTERTAASGRAWQPPAAIGPMMESISRPFRAWQRSSVDTDRGTGWVALAEHVIR